ncbi:MAG TPA: glycosyltransferase family 2 protein [Candidatus Limnocylindrales bacterium]|nr:glycosyltransferase family 2 protein [Candidatus Limnocylindrales bacterium]
MTTTSSARGDDGGDRGAATGTPGSWRLAAAAGLGGGLALGLRSSGRGVSRHLVTAISAGLLASVPAIIAAARRPPIAPRPQDRVADDALPTITVLVAARDEAAVIERLVEDVAAQDHRTPDGRPRFELIVIDDRSTDGTGQAALRAAAKAGIGDVTRFVRRGGEDLADGKGAALTAVPPEECRGDVITVLDADARIGPSFLRTLGGYVAAGASAVTPRRRVLDAGSSELAGAQADEQTVDGLIERGRWALGGCSEFRGNGITLRRDLLAAVGGWRASALTEDLDLSSRIAVATGTTVAWALDAEAWEEPVGEPEALWRQRTRWAEGALRRLFEHGPAVLRSERLGPIARADFAAYAGQLALPPYVIGVVVGSLLRDRPGPALRLVGAYAVAGLGLGWAALGWETDPAGDPLPVADRARRAVRVTLFGGLWLAAVPAALWRLATAKGPVRYEKMSHGA